jgi:hypothetical protein
MAGPAGAGAGEQIRTGWWEWAMAVPTTEIRVVAWAAATEVPPVPAEQSSEGQSGAIPPDGLTYGSLRSDLSGTGHALGPGRPGAHPWAIDMARDDLEG